MMKVDLIVHNANLVTCASNGKPKRGLDLQDVGLIEDGAVAIAAGKFAAVGKSAEILREYSSPETIDANGLVVCPGFVDPHTHIIFAGNRLDEFELKIKGADYLEILANGGGILSTVKHTREATIQELTDQTIKRLDKMLACGTTTAEVKTGYGLDAETEFKMMDVWEKLDEIHPIYLVPTFLAAHAIPPEFKNNSDEYVRIICDGMLPDLFKWIRYGYLDEDRFNFLEKSKKPFFVDVFCEKNAFDLEQTRRIFKAAKANSLSLKAHVDEFTNLGGSKLAIEYGATSIDHLDAISDSEIELLANSKTIGIITPTVNFNFGSSEFANARKLIDKGCAIALSTDYNPGSAPCPSQPLAMAISCRYQKLLPSEAFNAITVNSAFAIGLGDYCGSIEVGKNADLLILDTKDFRETAHEFGSNFVSSIVKSGKFIK
jgi:imidazolonepropionase